MSAGDALELAKQEYFFATEGLYGPYDEKVLESTVFYGLPMYRIGTGNVQGGPRRPD